MEPITNRDPDDETTHEPPARVAAVDDAAIREAIELELQELGLE